MRLILSLLVFTMASVTMAGAVLTLALAMPELNLIHTSKLFWVALAGFALALPTSYWIGGRISDKAGLS